MDFDTFITRWTASGAAERANKDSFLKELCDVLGVPHPDRTTGDPLRDKYVFEKDAIFVHEGERTTLGKMDLYRADCFVLEAKQGSDTGSKKHGTARRESPQWAIAMRDAYGQALQYVRTLDDPPPFVVTCDIGYCFDVYAAFDGSLQYRPFPNAQTNRLYLKDLATHAETLRKVWLDPHSIDPSKASAKITREVAGRLAELAKSLEKSGHAPEAVATFLMRCLFTMFAEDIGLLDQKLFEKSLHDYWLPNPKSFPNGVASLWHAMNTGGDWIVGKLLKFNGGLFANPDALPLSREQLELLYEAARCEWSDVEPAIFGTLLERALDPKERHKLGAHFTPRAYVERLVKPTIEEPLRAEWDLVQAEVRRLVGEPKASVAKAMTKASEKKNLEAAKAAVYSFHKKLCETTVLDPACGTGNFLYVTLDLLKRLESEVFALLADLGDPQIRFDIAGVTVTPAQFHGIEVKRWAKEIAEMVLWIGFLQHHARTRRSPEGNVLWLEPVLKDLHNIECRDAILAWDSIEIERDDKGKPKTRWDGETTKKSAVTGEEVPDETARVNVYRYVNPRKAEWPKTDFIVGNPPFIGKLRMLSLLGSGYVEALRATYKGDVPDSVDFVMYWWQRAASQIIRGAGDRFGFVTTNSITQVFNRRVVSTFLESEKPTHLAFAIADHPWVDTQDGAAVRVAMTVGNRETGIGRVDTVVHEMPSNDFDGACGVSMARRTGIIHPDLHVGPSVASSIVLRANRGLTSAGVMLGGRGFVIGSQHPVVGTTSIVKPLLNGNDILQRSRKAYVIDFFGLTADQARVEAPGAFQHVLDFVKPERDSNSRATRRDRWWLFSEVMLHARKIIAGLPRYIGTPETSKHRVFVRVEGSVLPEHPLLAIGLEDVFFLGVLSSRIHVTWALAAGGRLGVGNDPRYNKTRCFDPFPFPVATDAQKETVRALGEQLDAHRKRQQARHPELTITGMYNVLEKLRAGEVLTPKERTIHEQGLVSVLKQIHDELDAAVFDAYGWPPDLTDEQILERLVALNSERAEEERNGLVRWLRPEFQNPAGSTKATQTTITGTAVEEEDDEAAPAAAKAAPWPKKLAEQVAAVRDLVTASSSAWGVEQVAATFKGAVRTDVEDVLESLAALGVIVSYQTAKGDKRWRGLAKRVA